MLLKLNRETLAFRMETKNALQVSRLLLMLRRVDAAYFEKRKPKTLPMPELSELKSPPLEFPKRKLEVDPRLTEIQAKRLRFSLNPEAFQKQIEKEILNRERFPSLPRSGGGKKICYKCKEEGHLGRECTTIGKKKSNTVLFRYWKERNLEFCLSRVLREISHSV